MRRLREYTAQSTIGNGLKAAAAALVVVVALGAPNIAYAAPHGGGGGGSHGGGSHSGGGSHGGGGFHGGGFHGGVGGFHGAVYGAYTAGDYSDDYYGDEQPSPSQVWYYCSDPAGYYPYVTQCDTDWQMTPAD
jgi:hypothetical protein